MTMPNDVPRLNAAGSSDGQCETSPESALIRFRHGLGDCVQLTVVLQHLLSCRPHWRIDVQVVDPGKASIFAGFDRVRPITSDKQRQPLYDHHFNLEWHEPNCIQSRHVPATKAERCLREVFCITPKPDLCQYRIPQAHETDKSVDEYLRTISGQETKDGRYPVVALHYEGNTSADRKNLSHETMRRICDELLSLGLTPLILDWDRRSPLPNGQTIHCPDADHPLWKGYGTGDAGTLAKLINRCRLFIGIDSGPQKVAAATTTPMLCVWSKLHPIHYFPFSRAGDPFTRHVLRSCHCDHFRGERGLGEALVRRYDCTHYAVESPEGTILDQLRAFFGEKASMPQPQRPLPRKVLEPFVVGIPTLNRYDLCRGLIDSIFSGSAQPQQVFVIDNGQGDESFSHPDPRVSVLRSGRNLGVARSWNLLHEIAGPLPLVILNDDIELSHDSLEALITCDMPFVTLRPDMAYEAFLARKDVWRIVGNFDEKFWPAYCEDNDHSRRLSLAGIEIAAPAHGGVIQRGPSATRAAFSEDQKKWLDRCADDNRTYYQKKWGGLPGRERFTTPFNKVSSISNGTDSSLSIIIPTLGRSSLKKAIDAVLPQLTNADELIVVGNGPQKAFAKSIAGCYGDRLRYFEHEDPRSHYGNAQRNFGVAQAQKSWLWFIDDDDVVAEEAIRAVKEAIAEGGPRPLVFRMTSQAGPVIWDRPEIRPGNIGTPMVIVPRTGPWTPWPVPATEPGMSDFNWAEANLRGWGTSAIDWRSENIYLCGQASHGRPEESSATVNPYATHQRLLVRYLMQTTGPILELGCGGYSTPLIHEIAESQGRHVDSVDSDPSWMRMFQQFESNLHKLHLVADYDDFPPRPHYGLAFIDHAPHLRRRVDIRRLIGAADVFVIHDTESPEYGYDEIWPLLEEIETDKSQKPWTSVCRQISNQLPLPLNH